MPFCENMEISQDVKDKILKSAETIYSKGRLDEKLSKKNLSETGKEFLRFAENVAKRVDDNKNIPTDKTFKKKLTRNLEEITRASLIGLAGDALAFASTMPKAEKKTKESSSPSSSSSEQQN